VQRAIFSWVADGCRACLGIRRSLWGTQRQLPVLQQLKLSASGSYFFGAATPFSDWIWTGHDEVWFCSTVEPTLHVVWTPLYSVETETPTTFPITNAAYSSFLGMLTVRPASQEIPVFPASQRFRAVFTKALHWNQSLACSGRASSRGRRCLKIYVMLSLCLLVYVANVSSSFPAKTVALLVSWPCSCDHPNISKQLRALNGGQEPISVNTDQC
jgi:hypothetical protein